MRAPEVQGSGLPKYSMLRSCPNMIGKPCPHGQHERSWMFQVSSTKVLSCRVDDSGAFNSSLPKSCRRHQSVELKASWSSWKLRLAAAAATLSQCMHWQSAATSLAGWRPGNRRLKCFLQLPHSGIVVVPSHVLGLAEAGEGRQA